MPPVDRLILLSMNKLTEHEGPLTKEDLERVNLPAVKDAGALLKSFMAAADIDQDGQLGEEEFKRYALAFKEKFPKKFDYQSKDGSFSVADAIEMRIMDHNVTRDDVLAQQNLSTVKVKYTVPKR